MTRSHRNLLTLFGLCAMGLAATAAPTQETSWPQAMLNLRQVCTPTGAFKPFAATLQSGQPAQRISMDVSGVQDLWLVTDDGDRNHDRSIAIWGSATLIGSDGASTPLSKLKPASVRTGRRELFTNCNPDKRPLAIADKTFDQGLCAIGTSTIRYKLAGKYTKFEAFIGVEDTGKNAARVHFKVINRPETRQLWSDLEKQFPIEMDWMLQDAGPDAMRWPESPDAAQIQRKMIEKVLEELGAGGNSLKSELDALAASKAAETDPRWLSLYTKACQARRAIRLAPLAAKWPKIVFTKHHNMGGSHYAYTEAQSDAQAERTFHPGGALCQLEISADGKASIRNLIDDPNGVIRDPDISFDGRYILFAWKKDDRKDDYHLYEMEVASGKIRQITDGLGYADYEGQYLPNDDIIFSSTRVVQTVDCFTTEVSNLYSIARDGKYLRRLGFDQVHTNYPTVLEDGRVIYTRWEYNDRGQVFVQGLMQMNPDGTNQTEFYGMNSWFPTTILHARGIPNSNKIVAIATGHHSRQTGKLITVDNTVGQQENSGVQLIAPVRETKAVRVDSYGQDGELWQYPYPLDEKHFLVTYTPHGWAQRTPRFGIYFMDIDGRRELLASDPANSCNQSIPLAPRKRPIVKPSVVDYRENTGTIYMQDVYAGQGLAGIPRGTIKKLRVIALEYRLGLIGGNNNGGPAGGAFIATPVAIGNGSWDVKIVLGDAAVHEDGSAYFEAPARTPIFFQALDEKGYMVQSMRSWMTLQPGESASCVGCHETKNTTPLSQRKTYAMIAGPQKLEPFYGPARGFSFVKEVQPILDKRCISCHDDRTAVRIAPVVIDNPNVGAWANSKPVFPLEEPWAYTIKNPGDGWKEAKFDDSKWEKGRGGFGTRGTPAAGKVNTEWHTADIWIRRTFEITGDPAGRQFALIGSHDEDIEVYINGVMAACESGFITKARVFELPKAALAALKPGINTIAIHCVQTGGGQYIDMALHEAKIAAPVKPVEPVVTAPAKPKRSFSLLSTPNADPAAKRQWSDAYLALTAAKPAKNEAARGDPQCGDPERVAAPQAGKFPLVTWIHAQSTPPVQPPYFTGAARSRLMELLEKGHEGVKLAPEELHKIAAWIDLAVPFCGDYTESNIWSEEDWKRHNRLLEKRKLQEQLERKGIHEYLRDRQKAEVAEK